MTPKPYSDKSALPSHSSDAASGIPTEILPQTPSPTSLSGATTPSPTPQEQVPVEPFVDTVNVQESNRMPDLAAVTPCYPTPGDIMPYDHSLPDFIRQITNQPNLANLQSLSLRVISTLISLHRMAAYLPNLRELDLEGSVLNSLRDIGCSLKNLQILKVGRCQLESLDGTFGLSSLRELYAQKNFINDVSPCSNLPHIRHIDVSGNRIRNISYAGFLSVCNKLKSIVFTGNPATEVSDYRSHVRRILPQLETLDGVSFVSEGSGEEFPETELIENCMEGSDSSSAEALTVSPRDSPSEDLFLLDKKIKQAKNLANQDQSDTADCVLLDTSNEVNLEGEFQNRNSHQERKELPGQAKSNDNRNSKQKSTNIQKLDKDMENRSKKSSLLLNGNFGEEFECQSSEASTSVSKNDDLRKFHSVDEESARAIFLLKDVKSGVIRKVSSPEVQISGKSEDQKSDQNWGVNKLTTGLPVCGNLTAALRNRKKLQNTLAETQNYLIQKIHTESRPEVDESREPEIRTHDLEFECGDIDDDDIIGEDVLAASGKWRESFRRFRSNNRADWEGCEDEEKDGKQLHSDHLNEE